MPCNKYPNVLMRLPGRSWLPRETDNTGPPDNCLSSGMHLREFSPGGKRLEDLSYRNVFFTQTPTLRHTVAQILTRI